VVFAITYGNTIPIAGVFSGNLDNSGETLKLVKPGATPAQDLVINEVTYGSTPPWPTAADGFGPSLQLIDPAQDNRRVANWTAVTTNTPPPPLQWQYVTVTGNASSSTLYIYLDSAGDVYIDDIKLVAGSVPEVGPNTLVNGDFESGSLAPWAIGATGNNSASVVTSGFKHSGNYSLHLIASSGGSTLNSSISQNTSPALTQGASYTLSFWYFPSTNGGPLTVRLSNSANAHPPMRVDVNIAPPSSGGIGAQFTPGAPNSVLASLPTFPLLWLNEVQPNNVTGITDRFGQHHPWVELYNSGTNTINLGGYSLANNFSNLTQWAFPANAALNSGQFMVVYLDGNTNESINTELHAGFSIPLVSGSVALTKVLSNQTTMVVDYLNYNQISADRSYGAYPDGTPIHRQKFYFATPGAPNTNGYPATPVVINEWMAANSTTLADPADGKFDDWFELYNAGGAPVDLTDYTLTDNSTNTAKFVIPSGYSIPAGGYLLVWADKETFQNTNTSPDLHVNFQLSKNGEFIGLYAPNGTNVDAVSFGLQTNDISQGRWPDGNSPPFVFMTTPTPRAPNVYGTSSNAPPVLAAIGNQTVNELTLLTFTASASDPDAGESLAFSLDPGAPAGANINAASGVFTWTPTEAQGPGVYPVTVRVTDNGTPRLSAFATISITVNEVNTAPVLGPVSDQTVNEGTRLTFTVTASDADIPANTLTFSLDPGAPAGANINPITGVFSWTPPRGFSPVTNAISIRVTDNGSPPLSDVTTIQIAVVSAPRISGITRSSTNVVTITWQASAGKTYRVQYTSSLAPSTWITLGSDIVATGSAASKQDTLGTVVQRFYRVIQLN